MANLFLSQGHEIVPSNGLDMFSTSCDKAFVSVIFTYDLPKAVADINILMENGIEVEVGGPAPTAMADYLYEKTGIHPHLGLDARFENIPGNYQATFTSRGCPRACEFCIVRLVEGRKIIEYPDFPIPVGKNPWICDNNILSTTWNHQKMVVDRLKTVKNLDFNSGFDDRIFIKNMEKYWNLYSQLDLECYSEDTEILTENGFKLFPELKPDEKVATLNKDGFLEYQNPTKYYGYHYTGEMIHFNGRSYDFMVTPRHQMYVRPCRKEFQLIEANMVTKTSEFKRNLKWEGTSQDKITPIKEEYSMNLWLKFLGWWISEGSATIGYHKNGTVSGYQITIHQLKKENLEEIKKIVEEMGFKYGPQKDRVVFNDKDLCLYLKKLGKQSERYIPKEIKMLPQEQLSHIFETLMKGDGSQLKERFFYTTTSKKLASDISEIALKLGYCVTSREKIPYKTIKKNGETIEGKHLQWILSISKQNETPLLQKGEKQSINYDGMVYCVDVPNHTLLVKRNGKIGWSGNCWRFAFDSPEQREPIKTVAEFLHSKGVEYRRISVFCLIGHPNYTMEEDLERLRYLIDLEVSPYPMRYRPLNSLDRNYLPTHWENPSMIQKVFNWAGVAPHWRQVPWDIFSDPVKWDSWKAQKKFESDKYEQSSFMRPEKIEIEDYAGAKRTPKA